jgi:hypothetical protein
LQKLLFLDFDGVLHSTSAGMEELFNRAEDLADSLLGAQCAVVISSSWRFHHDFNALKKFLPLSLRPLIQGVTGSPVVGHWSRFEEIQQYLYQQAKTCDWRALDDDFLEFPKICPNLIRCHPKRGFSERERLILQEWLQQPGA